MSVSTRQNVSVRVLVVGDTHGNIDFFEQTVFPAAERIRADCIVQAGDFGWWEHEPDGIVFLDVIGQMALTRGICLYALHGNHDNWPLVMSYYGEDRVEGGFVRVRENLFYIPQGLTWQWEGFTFRGFGGAYSVDKLDLVAEEQRRTRRARQQAEGRRRAAATWTPADGPLPPRWTVQALDYAGTLWFPEEEMTEQEFRQMQAEFTGRVDVVFSHDKPRGANPGPTFYNIPECLPNQDRLQTFLRLHRPSFWFHGHLHHQYTDVVRAAEYEATVVVGLHCDPIGAKRSRRLDGYDTGLAWAVLDLDPVEGTCSYKLGAELG